MSIRKSALITSATQTRGQSQADLRKTCMVETLGNILPEISKASERITIVKGELQKDFASFKERIRSIQADITKTIEILCSLNYDFQKDAFDVCSDLHLEVDAQVVVYAAMSRYREEEYALRALRAQVEEYSNEVVEEEKQLGKVHRTLLNMPKKVENILQDTTVAKNARLKRMLNRITQVLDEVTDSLELTRMWVELRRNSLREDIRSRLAYEILDSFQGCEEDLERSKARLEDVDKVNGAYDAAKAIIETAQENLRRAGVNIEALHLQFRYEDQSISAAAKGLGEITQELLDVRAKVLATSGTEAVFYDLQEVFLMLFPSKMSKAAALDSIGNSC